ncbi:MAG: tetratricopeptide repeat protein [Ignavibacteriae bacterium]|nr:tetratricopeptide repeat protein [Ignavibacteriota bacterium]
MNSESPIAEELRRAQAAIAEERLNDALAAIASALALDPSNAEAMRMAVALGEHDEETRLAKIEQAHTTSSVHNSPADENSLQVHLANARRLFLEGQFDLAHAETTLALLVDPLSSDTLTLEKEIHLAITAKGRAGPQSSESINGILLVARRYVERDKLDRALEEIDTGLAMHPGHPELLWLRNDVCEKVRLKKELAVRNRKNELLLAIREHFARTEFDDALLTIQTALSEFPDDQDILQLEQQISAAQERWQQLHQFEKQKEAVNLHVTTAQRLMQQDKWDEALAEVALGLLVAPFSPDLTALEKQLLREQASDEEIEDTSATDTQIALRIISAEEYAKLGEFEKALDEIAHAYGLDPGNSDITKVEQRIRQLQRPQAGALKLIYSNEHRRQSNA